MVLRIHYLLVLLTLLVDSFFELDSFAVVETRLEGLLLFAHHEGASLRFNLQVEFRVGDLLLSDSLTLLLFFRILSSDVRRLLLIGLATLFGRVYTNTFRTLHILSLL